jgi:hypothetical protein
MPAAPLAILSAMQEIVVRQLTIPEDARAVI